MLLSNIFLFMLFGKFVYFPVSGVHEVAFAGEHVYFSFSVLSEADDKFSDSSRKGVVELYVFNAPLSVLFFCGEERSVSDEPGEAVFAVEVVSL